MSIDDEFWQLRIRESIARRTSDPLLTHTNARRLVFGESDGLPGVIVDDYAGYLVMQLSTLAASNARPAILDALIRFAQPKCIIERNDEERMKHEHIKDRAGVLYGQVPSLPVEVNEAGQRFLVDVASGQKTGFYLDQRENRARLSHYCHSAKVLNVFSYTGAFGIYAAANGAVQVINVDSSGSALKIARANLDLQPISFCEISFVEADAFDNLRARRDADEQYDVVILDPPKFAHSTEQIDRAARAYKDLNRIGMQLVRSGGFLATFSCSGVIDAALFQKIVFNAAIESSHDALIIERFTQASDHPVLVSFPESEYLKGLLCRIL